MPVRFCLCFPPSMTLSRRKKWRSWLPQLPRGGFLALLLRLLAVFLEMQPLLIRPPRMRPPGPLWVSFSSGFCSPPQCSQPSLKSAQRFRCVMMRNLQAKPSGTCHRRFPSMLKSLFLSLHAAMYVRVGVGLTWNDGEKSPSLQDGHAHSFGGSKFGNSQPS